MNNGSAQSTIESLNETQQLIKEVCNEWLRDFLLEKNHQYGNSATDPMSVFAKDASADLKIRVRLDDKISRLARGNSSLEPDDDIYRDIAGYIIMREVNKRLG